MKKAKKIRSKILKNNSTLSVKKFLKYSNKKIPNNAVNKINEIVNRDPIRLPISMRTIISRIGRTKKVGKKNFILFFYLFSKFGG